MSTDDKKWFCWPTEFPGVVTQSFGNDPGYYRRFTCGGSPLLGHEGLDMRAFVGTEIYCCYDGVISRVEHNEDAGGNYGIQVRVEHNIGGIVYKTAYAHLQAAFDWEVGDEVKRGQVLGLADSTGNAFGSHLHLTLKRMAENNNGWPCNIIDPTPYFKETNKTGVSPIVLPEPEEPEPDPLPDPEPPTPPDPGPIPDPPDPPLDERRGCLQMLTDILMMR
jgi:murein DD-endopeptidase MepM/ murein hydrolase activator NlpD